MKQPASRYEWLISDEVADSEHRAVVVPVGSIEQHGPHLPLGTDLILAEDVVSQLVDPARGIHLGPPIHLGCSDHHMTRAGTVSAKVDTFRAMISDLCTSLTQWFDKVILVNGHGGNMSPLKDALQDLGPRGIRPYAFTYWQTLDGVIGELFGEDAPRACGHAGALETSLMLYLHPELVRHSAVPAGGLPPTWPDPHMFATDGVHVYRPFTEFRSNGVIGIPELATAAAGERLFNAAVCRAKSIVDRIVGPDS